MPRGERPLEAGDARIVKFAAELRQLRQRAGRPTYRQLAERAHYSVSTLSGAASGKGLPTLAVTLAYVRACDGDEAEWERAWHALAAEVGADGPAPDADRPDSPAPYVGLAAYQASDTEWFFGRERLVDELVRRLRGQRLMLVIGASGSGKSSLLRAGLVPRLPAGATAVVFTPGARPMEECAVRLGAAADITPGRLYQELVDDPANLGRVARQISARSDAGDGDEADGEVVLVVDQFEELFTHCAPGERDHFITALLTAATADGSRCRVVLGVRADFYAHCTRHPDLVAAMRDAQVPVGPMGLEELRRAVVQPAVRAGLTVEGSLLATLAAQALGQAGVLPLLSHALLETWRRRRGNALTLEAYRATGGLEGALARTAEEFYAELSDERRELARQVFVRLTALGEGTEDTRRRVPLGELAHLGVPAPPGPDSERVQGTGPGPGQDMAEDVGAVLESAARARLLTLDKDRVELTHEALIRCWPRLHGWLTEDRERLRVLRQLTEAARTWESLGRDPDALFRGARLALVREAGDQVLSGEEHAFLDASAAAERAESARGRRRARRMRRLTALLAVLLSVAVAAAGLALRARDELTRERNTVLAREVALEAVALRQARPALATQLGVAADRLSSSATTRDALLGVTAASLLGHEQAVSALAFRPDGRMLATVGYDYTVRLWDLTVPFRPVAVAEFQGGPDIMTAVAFSPDGRRLATGGRDRTVRLWDVSHPRRPAQLRVLRGHTDIVFSVAFSPDGRTLASGSYDHTVRLWDTTSVSAASRPVVLRGHRLNVKPIAFSPDGRLLASGSDDRTVRLWDVTSPRRPRQLGVLAGHRDFVDAVTFSPDGRTVASGSDDRAIRLWNIADPRRPRVSAVLTGHTDVVSSVAFSPDGRLLASGSTDRTARLWDVTATAPPRPRSELTGHLGAVNAVAFRPGEGAPVLVTGSSDHTAQVWRTDWSTAREAACQRARPVITAAEWKRRLPGIPYNPPCGR
ncbi:XRE family transcriptional regulator [Streptomyces sp. DG2A-72]|uniref:nSTAND1 domain-containing NTPase n=1 Tax=Streptomyces sp. DG2A-72 TaxID=3051386 RepID=UPI00265C5E82|nr:XRE family transcriptional regulator [Streptomyces sp. DG2A-72]MDO0938537.1 XRE family transcriptional regulator [Streptomyces sp. DG2A-72]